MKKTTTRVTIVCIALLAIVVGYYAYLSNRRHESNQPEPQMSAAQLALSRDLTNDYPGTVKEVIKYYNDLQKCFYNGECTDEEIRELGLRARELYDEELLAHNDVDLYLIRLNAEIQDYKERNRRITSASVASSTNVDFFGEDGYDFARIYCSYNVMEGTRNSTINQVFLLRRDEARRWKIYGWDSADHVKVKQE